MRRHVELSARVAVDHHDVAVVRAQAADTLVMVDLKWREGRPGAGIFGRDQQREVNQSRTRERSRLRPERSEREQALPGSIQPPKRERPAEFPSGRQRPPWVFPFMIQYRAIPASGD